MPYGRWIGVTSLISSLALAGSAQAPVDSPSRTLETVVAADPVIHTNDRTLGIAGRNQYVVVKEGTQDCGPCRKQEPLFGQIAQAIEQETANQPDLIGFVSLDLGTLRTAEQNRITSSKVMPGIPAYSIWKRGENGQLSIVAGSEVRSADQLEERIAQLVPQTRVTYPVIDQTSGLDLAANTYTADFLPDVDAVPILDRLATHPETVTYVPVGGTQRGAFRITYNLADPADFYRAFNSGSKLPVRQLKGRAELATLDRALYRERAERIMNPNKDPSKGVSLALDAVDLGGIEQLIAGASEDSRAELADSYSSFNPTRIRQKCQLRDDIISTDSTYTHIEGSNDIGDAMNIVGDHPVDFFFDHPTAAHYEQVAQLRAGLYAAAYGAYACVISPEHQALVGRYHAAATAHSGYVVPHDDSFLTNAANTIEGRDKPTFGRDMSTLHARWNALEDAYHTATARGSHFATINSSIPPQGSVVIIPYTSGRAEAFIGAVDRASKLYGIGRDVYFVEVPQPFGDLPVDYPIRRYLPRSGGVDETYILLENGKPTYFGNHDNNYKEVEQ